MTTSSFQRGAGLAPASWPTVNRRLRVHAKDRHDRARRTLRGIDEQVKKAEQGVTRPPSGASLARVRVK